MWGRSCALAAAAAVLAGCGAARPTIGVAVRDFEDRAASGARLSIEAAAAGAALLDIADGGNRAALQREQVEAIVGRRPAAIMVDPVDRTASGAMVSTAKAAGVPIVFFGREPMPGDLRAWDRAYYVGAKPGEEGAAQGRLLARSWRERPAADRNRDGVMQYVLLAGSPGEQETLLRSEFAVRAVAESGVEARALAEDSAHWSRPEARAKTAALIARYGSRIEAILCGDDETALGAADAYKAAGLFRGAGSIPPIAGIGASKEALDAVEAGLLAGTVLADAEAAGRAAFDLAYALARKRGLPKTRWAIEDGKYLWIPPREFAMAAGIARRSSPDRPDGAVGAR